MKNEDIEAALEALKRLLDYCDLGGDPAYSNGHKIISLAGTISKALEAAQKPVDVEVLEKAMSDPLMQGDSSFGHGRLVGWNDCMEQLAANGYLRQPLEEWQPIETAPRDGTRILLFRPKSHAALRIHIKTGRWSKKKDGWYVGDGNYWEEELPTHWMPLPKPPNDTQS